MEKELVIKAKNGSKQAFEKLITLYERRLYGFATGKISIFHDVQEVVQETLLICFVNLKNLRNEESFSFWLFRICRNCVNRFYKVKSKIQTTQFNTEDQKNISDENKQFSEWEHYEDIIEIAIAGLSPEQNEALTLHYFSGLSYKKTAALCGISENRVKSRLFEARKVLKKRIPDLYHGIEIPHHKIIQLKENVMKKTEIIESGAFAIHSLSLKDQMHLCELIVNEEEFDEKMLSALGAVPEGREFVKNTNGRLLISEFSKILTFDPALDRWLIYNLEKKSPEIAEKLKMNVFIFEDIVLLDIKDIPMIMEKIQPPTLLTAISACDQIVKKYLLSFLEKNEKNELLLKLPEIDTCRKAVNAAQYEIVETIRELEANGSIKVQADEGWEEKMKANFRHQNISL